MPLLEYKADSFSLEDMNDINQDVSIKIFSDKSFSVKGALPNSDFDSKGFMFTSKFRARATSSYLSSVVVSDQRFIKSDPNGKPNDDNSPDLRLNVNNPFSGKRFKETDVLFLDKNRLYQIRSGSFNQTRYDRLTEDFNYQFLKKSDTVKDLNSTLGGSVIKGKVENSFLTEAIGKFKKISDIDVHIALVDNYKPFDSSFFAWKKENNQQIKLSALGSGYEMIFTLLYSFFLAQQSKKKLIVLIDEPELHMHPKLQQAFIDVLLDMSTEAQIFLSTHSPLLIKQLEPCGVANVLVLIDGPQIVKMEERKLPFISANEINYLAFGLATEEYHNDLYEELKFVHGDDKDLRLFDKDFFIDEKGEAQDSPWKSEQNQVSIHTFIRNQIHHPKDNKKPEYNKMKESIETMRDYL